jgi:uncharacterized membrane protein (UPF0136 family)
MSRTLSIDLLAYALILPGLSVLAQRMAPAFGMTSVITGIVGGALLASCAVLAIRGQPRQRWALLTLVVLAVVLLAQAVSAWLAVRGGAVEAKPVAMIRTLLLLFTLVQAYNISDEKPSP